MNLYGQLQSFFDSRILRIFSTFPSNSDTRNSRSLMVVRLTELCNDGASSFSLSYISFIAFLFSTSLFSTFDPEEPGSVSVR